MPHLSSRRAPAPVSSLNEAAVIPVFLAKVVGMDAYEQGPVPFPNTPPCALYVLETGDINSK